jgi:aspartate ammonia-lyase
VILPNEEVDVPKVLSLTGGKLQLNAFEPIIAHSLFAGLQHLANACRVLADTCVVWITANRELMRRRVIDSIALVTAFSPRLGYETAMKVAQEALLTGAGVGDIVLARGLLTAGELDELVSAAVLSTRGGTP